MFRAIDRIETLVLASAAGVLLCGACAPDSAEVDPVEAEQLAATGLALFEPPSGAYFGANLDLAAESVAQFNQTMGVSAVSYVTFVSFPLSSGDTNALNGFINQVKGVGGIAVITLEPWGGLSAVTSAACDTFVSTLKNYESQGARMMIRFAHEMNGSWYPWAQHPSGYRNAFRLLAGKVKASLKKTAMLWAPNNGIGYPWAGGQYSAKAGTADYTAMDTNHDGKVTSADDAYGPYYPGDDVVDWVGFSSYHWGRSWSGANEVPTAYEFSTQITGLNAPATDFYKGYCTSAAHNKPMAITETSALYNTQQGGASEYDIKTAWWKQVYNISGVSGSIGPDIADTYPHLKMINWFDYRKQEAQAGNNVVDWRISANSTIRGQFVSNLNKLKNGKRYFLNLGDFKSLGY